MRLSDRLRRAKAQRDAGLAPPVRPEDELALDLTVRSTAETATQPGSWSYEAACPACGAESEVDLLDLIGGVMKQHCTACEHAWVTQREVDAESS
jgi:hypothetical protein